MWGSWIVFGQSDLTWSLRVLVGGHLTIRTGATSVPHPEKGAPAELPSDSVIFELRFKTQCFHGPMWNGRNDIPWHTLSQAV